MKAELLLRAVNQALGLAYAAWVMATMVLGWAARRAGPGGRGRAVGWIRRLCRIGAGVGAGSLAAGVAGCLANGAPPAMGRLIWPGVVMPATALLIWARLRQGAGKVNQDGVKQWQSK